ncbi:MAG: hypoxanthine-guanine phosphoribosyltransferase [Gammaproteobacteria bacterium]|nr:hypoxanthine-guanine phosphoribosyltransferase [Gammaproteobacteria bacterium]MBU1447108.1 hypoxanthine-guanine phosphoribosyltransferase [Gammaproteobacteria bacterium]MDD5471591.1 hypoxanthine-guanine phosphoribosyltransferase [Sideroxydans sp.]
MMTDQRAREILAAAELLHDADEVQRALQRVAQEINTALAGQHPLVLSVMGGAVVFSGQLLPLLDFPLDFDYLHVSRYGNEKQGGQLNWKVAPRENVRGKVVLVLDDILDEGETMHAIKQRVLELGATSFYCAVFADKDNGRAKPISADFVGLSLPNRFVFGYGMDIHGAWRNLPAIYAVKEE